MCVCACAGGMTAQRRLLRIGILTIGILCIMQAVLNISLWLACKFRKKKTRFIFLKAVWALALSKLLCNMFLQWKRFCNHSPQLLFPASSLERRYRSIPFQQFHDSRSVPDWPVSTEFNRVVSLLQQAAEETSEGVLELAQREASSTQQGHSTD